MKTVMSRCHGCGSTIKRADVFHKTHTTITGLPYRGWRDVELGGSIFYAPDYWCCNCVGHELAECKEQIAQDIFNMGFKQALVKSMGGVTRQGFLESDQRMKDYYKSTGVLRDA